MKPVEINIRQNKDFKSGWKVEVVFTKLMMKLGYKKPIVATKDQDIFEHWDRKFIGKNGKEIFIDIKSIKFNDENYNLIEFRNNRGNDGWIFGKADYIAFETNNSFLVVDRIKLKEYAFQFIDCDINDSMEHIRKVINDPIGMITERSFDIDEDLYLRYKRLDWNNDDVSIIIRTKDLYDLNPFILYK